MPNQKKKCDVKTAGRRSSQSMSSEQPGFLYFCRFSSAPVRKRALWEFFHAEGRGFYYSTPMFQSSPGQFDPGAQFAKNLLRSLNAKYAIYILLTGGSQMRDKGERSHIFFYNDECAP